MARTILASALAALVLASVSQVAAQDAGGGAARIVERARLPVLGTVGDYPPKSESIEVEVATEARLRIGGRNVDLAGLQQVLAEQSKGRREETGAQASKLYAVLRVDRDVHWQDVQWVLQTCAAPEVRVYRILFAAVPENGGEEGAMALFLPQDRGTGTAGGPAPPRTNLTVGLRSETPIEAAPGPTLWAGLPQEWRGGKVSGPAGTATIDADPSVSTGAVLSVVDTLLRGGCRSITLKGTTAKPSKPRSATSQDQPRLLLLGKPLEPPVIGAPTPPRVARVTGALAGQSESPVLSEPLLSSMEGPKVVEEGDDDPAAGAEHRDAREGDVDAGLDWLKRHQSQGGNWDSDGFEAMCKGAKCGGNGGPLFDIGLTGLATVAFLGRGETHRTPRYGAVVRSALKSLKAMQDAEGCFGARTSNHFTYNHALGTLAMAEAYARTQSPLFQSSAQNGANFAMQCRNPYLAWRYGVRPSDNDTSTTGWMVSALKAAERAGLDVEKDAFEGAVAWLDKVTEPEYGRVGYTARGNGPARPQDVMDKFPMDKTESLTAVGVYLRLACGAPADHEMVRKGAELCMRCLPVRDVKAGTIDYVYWYYGSLAMSRIGGDRWEKWSEAVTKAVTGGQRRDLASDRDGSWDPEDPWAADGGRIYSTAMGVLCLEIVRGPR
jgi:biopolymer transport protein ExbD